MGVVRRGTPKRDTLWAPRTRAELKSYPRIVQKQLGRAIEAAQWGVCDTNATRMKGRFREVVEVRADGPSGETYRAVYYPSKHPAGPIVVLHVFKKKSTQGVSTPKRELDRIEQRLKRFKHEDT
jgi:phage-related protein